MSTKKVIIFGLGKYFRDNYERIKEQYEVVGYSDNNSEWNGKEGYIFPKEIIHFLAHDVKILVCSLEYYDEIKQSLMEECGAHNEHILSKFYTAVLTRELSLWNRMEAFYFSAYHDNIYVLGDSHSFFWEDMMQVFGMLTM